MPGRWPQRFDELQEALSSPSLVRAQKKKGIRVTGTPWGSQGGLEYGSRSHDPRVEPPKAVLTALPKVSAISMGNRGTPCPGRSETKAEKQMRMALVSGLSVWNLLSAGSLWVHQPELAGLANTHTDV